MGDRRRAHCQRCKGHRDEVGLISWTGLCVACSKANVHENLDQLDAHAGPRFAHWRRRVAMSVGATLLDELAGAEQTVSDAGGSDQT